MTHYRFLANTLKADYYAYSEGSFVCGALVELSMIRFLIEGNGVEKVTVWFLKKELLGSISAKMTTKSPQNKISPCYLEIKANTNFSMGSFFKKATWISWISFSAFWEYLFYASTNPLKMAKNLKMCPVSQVLFRPHHHKTLLWQQM